MIFLSINLYYKSKLFTFGQQQLAWKPIATSQAGLKHELCSSWKLARGLHFSNLISSRAQKTNSCGAAQTKASSDLVADHRGQRRISQEENMKAALGGTTDR